MWWYVKLTLKPPKAIRFTFSWKIRYSNILRFQRFTQSSKVLEFHFSKESFFPDSKAQDSWFYKQKLLAVFKIPWTKFCIPKSRISDSTGKNCLDPGIRCTLHVWNIFYYILLLLGQRILFVVVRNEICCIKVPLQPPAII